MIKYDKIEIEIEIYYENINGYYEIEIEIEINGRLRRAHEKCHGMISFFEFDSDQKRWLWIRLDPFKEIQ